VTVTLVADAGPEAGLGHLRRVGALGTALTDLGIATAIVRLESGPSTPVDAAVAVVDSYRVRADDESIVRARTVCAVDELGRDLAVALSVDPTPGATAAMGHRAGRALAGAEYVLVDPVWCAPPTPVPGGPPRVLVTFGATAAAEAALAVAAELVATCPEASVAVAVGPHRSGTPAPAGVELFATATGIDDAIRAATVVVCAGGVTMLEACAAARPVVAVTVVPNQAAAVDALDARGAVVGSTIDAVAATARALLVDEPRRDALAAAARAAIDGAGATRVARAVAELVS